MGQDSEGEAGEAGGFPALEVRSRSTLGEEGEALTRLSLRREDDIRCKEVMGEEKAGLARAWKE